MKKENLRIYQIVIDRFDNPEKPLPAGSQENDFLGGNLNGVISKLPYIKKMGYNAILLSPVLKAVAYHGYNQTDCMEIDERIGDWTTYRRTVNVAHEHGISVIQDVVPNHVHYQNDLFQKALKGGQERDWFFFTDKGDEYVSYMDLPDLPKVNLEHPEAASYMIDMTTKLASAGVDMLRLDHAIGLPFSFLKKLSKTLHKKFPGIKIIGEVWGAGLSPEIVDQISFKSSERRLEFMKGQLDQETWQRDYVGILDGVLDFRFREIILDEIRKGHRIKGNNVLRYKLIEHFRQYPDGFKLILLMDNHDTNRVLYECKQDVSLMLEIIEEMRNLNRDFSIYYGTERLMTNLQSIEDGTPYADLRVRTPMEWDKETINIFDTENEYFNKETTMKDIEKRNSHNGMSDEFTTWVPTEPRWQLSSIIASDALKAQLHEISVFMQNLDTIKAWGLHRFHKGGCYVMNFHGLPGTGKSLSAEALANECGMKIITVSYSDLQSSKWSGTEKNLTSLFECAKANNAMIIFNEADHLFSSRSDGPNSDVNNMIKTHLINLLDTYEVMVALTTNRFFSYDDAFFRRTLFQIHVPLPGSKELTALAKFHMGCEEEGCSEGGVIPKSDGFSYANISEILKGLSGGDIACITLNVMVKTIMSPDRKLTEQMLREAVENYHQSREASRAHNSREVTGEEKENVLKIINNN